ncbi:MAG TPA: polyprenyl synthetase family protein [Holophaga sp.]|nr:polyprenyl synthetase family protein [Holophaga sp.]
MTLNAAELVKADLDRLIPLFESHYLKPFEQGEAPVVGAAMRYSLEAGGKRVRPALCMLAAEAVGAAAEQALPSAIALEFIHTYSLIHDDLPAMDDDDLRRGKPTCHKAFGEGQAILAGDGLLTEAFAVLASNAALEPEARIESVRLLAEASGWRGMVGGQSLDLEGEKLTASGGAYGLDHLQLIHRLKTGALLRVSMELGAVAGGAQAEQRKALRDAGTAIGLAFQIQDDILDATSTAEQMGKRVGKDEGKGKITYPGLLGLEGARAALAEATERALAALKTLPHPDPLSAWARYLAQRGN